MTWAKTPPPWFNDGSAAMGVTQRIIFSKSFKEKIRNNAFSKKAICEATGVNNYFGKDKKILY